MLSDTKLGAFGRVIQLRFLGSQVFAIQTTIVEIMVHLSYDEVKLLIYGYIRHFFFSFASYYGRYKTFEFVTIRDEWLR